MRDTFGKFRTAAEETCRGLFQNPKAFAAILGNDASQVLGPVLTGLGAVAAAAVLTGSLPAGLAIGSAIGLTTGALKHLSNKIRGHGPPSPA